jgi:DNA repair ATPase RecN
MCWLYFEGKTQELLDEVREDGQKKADGSATTLRKIEIQCEDYKRDLMRVGQEREALRSQVEEAKKALSLAQAEAEVALKRQAAEAHTHREALQSDLARLPLQEARLKDQEACIHHLETKIAEGAALTERLHQRDEQVRALEARLQQMQSGQESLSRDLTLEAARRATAEEKAARVGLLEEKTRKLEIENGKLLRENGELCKASEDLAQFERMKTSYEKALEENSFLKQQHFVRNFVEIRKGLDQSLQAYQKAFGMFDPKAVLETGKWTDLPLPAPEAQASLAETSVVPAVPANDITSEDESSGNPSFGPDDDA